MRLSATIRLCILLYGYSTFNMRVWVVIFECKIFKFKIEDVFYFRVQYHFRQWARLTRKLKLQLLHVVVVNVGIAKSVYEIAGL